LPFEFETWKTRKKKPAKHRRAVGEVSAPVGKKVGVLVGTSYVHTCRGMSLFRCTTLQPEFETEQNIANGRMMQRYN
jgi:hypothetical protein